MKIQTKYNIGDRIHVICSQHLKQIKSCSVCNDTKKYVIDNIEYHCPACGPNGRTIYVNKWLPYENGRIGKITVEVVDPKEVEYQSEFKATYMIDSTGVGSGNLWPEEDCFPSKAEALAECEKRNKKI